jgi:hypothetical protein
MASNNNSHEHDHCGLSLAERGWAAARFDDPDVPIEPRGDRILPAVLLPSVAGEPLRFDDHWPAHNRGFGGTWPPDSRVDQHSGSGRFPIAAALSGLIDQREWFWESQNGKRTLKSSAAIGSAAASIVRRYAKRRGVLAVPNWLREEDQQLLLDQARRSGGQLNLLWQPIAAALNYLRCHPQIAAGDDRLLHIHCSWGRITVTRLKLITEQHDGQTYIIPARRRPSYDDDTFPGFGWTYLESYLNRQQDLNSFRRRWSFTFVDRQSTSESRYAAYMSSANSSNNSVPNHPLLPWAPPQESITKAREWLYDQLTKTTTVRGVVLTGDGASLLAGLPTSITSGGSPITSVDEIRNGSDESAIFRRGLEASGCALENVTIADGMDGHHYLACGAAIYGNRSRHQLPTYYDMLPKISLMLELDGALQWISLLEDENEYVEGGKQWERSEPITGLAVPSGQETIHLPVAHEEYDTVRQLTVALPNPVTRRVPAELSVTATPAAGHATLELRFPEGGIIGGSRILADWRRMVDTNKTADAYIDEQPRSFPEILPRLSSRQRWSMAIREFGRFQERLSRYSTTNHQNSNDLNFEDWDNLKHSVQNKDPENFPRDATAVDSDGLGPNNEDDIRELASVLLPFAMGKWFEFRATAIRILGYISYDSVEFQEFLVQKLRTDYNENQCVLHSCGLCLRAPHLIKNFFNHYRPLFETPRPDGLTNIFKAMAQILQYRPDATSQLPSDVANLVMDQAITAFEFQTNQNIGGFTFRYTALIVVFMLRRRMYDTSFFEPHSQRAKRAKESFSNAIKRYERGQLTLLAGAVDVPNALEQVIEYIDKRGTGIIIMGDVN